MNNLKKILCCLLFLPLTITGQESGYSEDVSKYLDSNGTMLQYEYAYAELIKILSGHYPENKGNAHKWKYLKENRSKELKKMKHLLIPIYESNFTKSEINRMLTFYKTEAGTLLIKDRTKMTETHKSELKVFYISEIGKKINAKQEILSQEVSKVSEVWSRNLYMSSLNLLKNE
ncbi:DUF2059 domain-containing protein [Maribacter sp. HTCC2170]|uniref:DUF2059 domain-containing protein n=1 Tax=Maribacter sp. (strain HTCC2170 / KCCM 42371) TaxID=313603 RepID=UPI00006BD312|nr:DUF2059 domain-containing protein [Maribacter sp. HTCC2170]EAR02062.1 hypothetical protein FB2170_02225 [Maribacter sp. HTCC2170]